METLTSDNDQQLKYSSWQLVRDMYRFVKPYKGSFIVATTLRILCDLAWLYPPIALAQTVTFLTAYKPGVSLAPLSTIFIFFALATCVRFGGGYLVKMTMFRTSERSALDAQMATILHLFSVDISWHEKENTGNKLKKITRGADSIDRLLRIWINNLIPIIVNFFGITYIIIRFNTKVALITLTFLFMYFILSRIFRVRASRASIISNKQEEVLEGVLFESLNNIRTVKVLGMAPALSKTLLRESNDYYQKILQRLFWNQTSGYTRSFFANVFKLCLMAFIVFGITKGWYTVSFLIIFYGYFGSLVDSVGELADISQDYIVAKISVSRMFEVLTVPVGIDSAEGKVSFPSEWKKISFQNVSFGYGENQVLHDISFDIMRGQKVGIIGLSGAGKSTIFKLLLKEHESYTGEILIDGVPLRDISKHDYFNYSAVVLQDTEVFNFSLKENITLANASEANNKELFTTAVRVAHVDDFISRLPLGTETLIGEKGVRLSGGERQRVGIARAVFKSPQLLLLDEATSHLDIESEEKIRESLHEFFTTVTAVVIAHRLTTIKEMDRIIVIEDGKILEEGSFDELYVKKGGRFQELWNKQSL